jgi:hypothetical protein
MSTHRTLAMRLLDALIEAGTWMNRVELQACQDCSAVALEDALADLVTGRHVDYRANVGYRLAGTNVCRRAAQLRLREGKKLAVVGGPSKDGYRLGFAEDRGALGVVMYEMALPLPAPDQDALQVQLEQVGAVVAFVNSRGEG